MVLFQKKHAGNGAQSATFIRSHPPLRRPVFRSTKLTFESPAVSNPPVCFSSTVGFFNWVSDCFSGENHFLVDCPVKVII
ncbi:MAG: hypothetical protein D6714_17730 [Bacteroidetes bacterium]|nr:MAG: hypothetical protein D6714_17730 [Bacteroidota bacterium]